MGGGKTALGLGSVKHCSEVARSFGSNCGMPCQSDPTHSLIVFMLHEFTVFLLFQVFCSAIVSESGIIMI